MWFIVKFLFVCTDALVFVVARLQRSELLLEGFLLRRQVALHGFKLHRIARVGRGRHDGIRGRSSRRNGGAGVALNDTRYEITTSQFTSAQFSNTFQGFFTGNFTGFFTRNYTLFFNGNVGGFFTGTVAKNFSNNFSNFFTGFFTSNFTGIRVQNTTETVNTVRLWVRIA